MSSTYHGQLTVSIFGQSHGSAIGVTLDGLPPGEAVDLDSLQAFLNRRAPGQGDWSTPRKEADRPEILSGLLEGRTCGAPLTAIIRNTNTRSGDYANLKDLPRPGHADYTAQIKYGGFQDSAGGGHFSGRLTAPLVAAGAVAKQLLAQQGIWVGSHISAVYGVLDRAWEEAEELRAVSDKPFPVLDDAKGEEMKTAILEAKQDQDSVGGSIECVVCGLPAGLGAPDFGRNVEGIFSQHLFAVPAVKAVAFGAGVGFAYMRGTEANDPFEVKDGKVLTKTNWAGGINGGITNGMPVVFEATLRPTPSIGLPQESVDLRTGEEVEIEITGRHDPCVVHRAVPAIEAAAALAACEVLGI